MRRRDFLAALGAAAALPRAAATASIPRIGVIDPTPGHEKSTYLSSLLQGFSDLGYVEGKSIVLELRFAAGQRDRYDQIATELVKAGVDILVAITPGAALAAQRATTTIPIVFVSVSDPIGLKLIESLAHPGGNLTGMSNVLVDLSGKRLELLKEAVPGLSRVALLSNPTFEMTRRFVDEHLAAANKLGLSVQQLEAPAPAAIEPAIKSVVKGSGLVVMGDPMLFTQSKQIAEVALTLGLPTSAWVAEMSDAGLLMSYGPNFRIQFRRVATYVDKILKGFKPADLPVEEPALFEFVINAGTAKALGLTIVPTLLAQADRVIE